jgi:hypothetical protein
MLPEPSEPPVRTRVEELEPNLWKITLAWSQEALNQAAYEMTFWYMSQAGRHVYKDKNMPKDWEYMTSEEAGYNAIKMMLYYIPLRYISKRQERLAIRLYNVYCFGYPLGVDSKEMLWPEDFPDKYENGGDSIHITGYTAHCVHPNVLCALHKQQERWATWKMGDRDRSAVSVFFRTWER